MHGYIRVYDVERDIVNTRPFQRLRHVRQLGLSSLVYHGAEHTRFGHSLGVMNFADRIFDSLVRRHRPEIAERYGWNQEDLDINRQRLRMAALLHDIGHAPFSHASETLFPKGYDHESYGGILVRGTEVGQVIESYADDTGVSLESTLELLSKKPLGADAFLKRILDGELDADRMDYLIRDSLYTGVMYGRFDYDRVVETLCLVRREDESFDIGVEERGMHAAEAFVLARYFMFTQVYFHVLRRIYDIHLRDLLEGMLAEKGPGGVFPSDPEEYLEWDDTKVLAYAKVKCREDASHSASRILGRKHFECIGETPEHAQGADVTQFFRRRDKVREGFAEARFIDDVSDKAPYRFDESQLRMRDRSGQDVYFAERSSLVRNLPRIHQHRLYTNPEIADAARESFYAV